MVFNLSNEFAFKFNLCVFGDKSSDIQSRTSFLLQGQVIYLESDSERYEICRKLGPIPKDSQQLASASMFTFSKIKNPIDLDNEFFSKPST